MQSAVCRKISLTAALFIRRLSRLHRLNLRNLLNLWMEFLKEVLAVPACLAPYCPEMVMVAPLLYAANSGAYMGCTVAGATLNAPAVAARMRYLNVYSP
jgi:hypothetical protein